MPASPRAVRGARMPRRAELQPTSASAHSPTQAEIKTSISIPIPTEIPTAADDPAQPSRDEDAQARPTREPTSEIGRLSMRLDDLFTTLPGSEDALEALDGDQESATCPFTLASMDMDAGGLERDPLTYGEISMEALATAIREGCGDEPATHSFLDLGSGSGRAVLAAAALGLAPVAGIELLPSLVDLSRQAARLTRGWSSWPPATSRAHFVHGDLLEIGWWTRRYWMSSQDGGEDGWGTSEAPTASESGAARSAVDLRPSVVYCCATKFGPDMRAQLYERLCKLRIGTKVIIATHPLRPEASTLGAGKTGAATGAGAARTMEIASPRPRASPRSAGQHGGGRLVEVWRKELPFSWGSELVRVYRVAQA